mgnify:CR=1 FL=1
MIEDRMTGDNVTEYEKRALDPCWQHKQECIAMFTLDSHNTSYLYCREDGTYYWQHCRKEAEDDIFVDADGLQLDLLGDPVLSKEWILKWNDIPNETLIYPGQIIELKLSEIN